jgi:hypothetical protein
MMTPKQWEKTKERIGKRLAKYDYHPDIKSDYAELITEVEALRARATTGEVRVVNVADPFERADERAAGRREAFITSIELVRTMLPGSHIAFERVALLRVLAGKAALS